MKKYFVFFIALSNFVLALNGQMLKTLHGVNLNYDLLMKDEISFHQTIFDSTLIKQAGYKLAEINVLDSSVYSVLKENEYSEKMNFSFLENGKINTGTYVLKHPSLHLTVEFTYNFQSSLKFIYMARYSEMTENNYASQLIYNKEGKMLLKETWKSLDGKEINLLSDTILKKFDSLGISIDDHQNEVSKGFDRIQGFSTSFLIPFNRMKMINHKSSDTTFYDVLSFNKKESGTDTTRYSGIEVCNSSGKIIFSDYPFYNQLRTIKNWKYDNSGYLIYYSQKGDGDYSYEIIRGQNELPLRIIYRTFGRPVVFDFTYK